MSQSGILHKFLTWLIAFVWLINGLFCKVLNLVPRHQLIVASILGSQHAGVLTKTIGIAEIVMAVWVISGIKSRWCAITQMAVIAAMNSIEFFLAPHLLLFERWNALFALLLILVIYGNTFLFHKQKAY